MPLHNILILQRAHKIVEAPPYSPLLFYISILEFLFLAQNFEELKGIILYTHMNVCM